MKKRKFDGYTMFLAAVAVLILVLGVKLYGNYGTSEYVDVVVKDKERVCEGSGSMMSCRYLIFTDSEVFENVDSWWHFKFNSSDIYAKLNKGKKAKIKVYGYRVPFLSWYRNITKIN